MHDPACAAPDAAAPFVDPLPPQRLAHADAQGIAVHPFAAAQAGAVRDLVLSIQQQEFGLPVSAASQPDLLDIPLHYRRGRGNFWVALRDAEVVGCIGLLDIGAGRGALRKMFVAAPWRGHRFAVAQRLLQHLMGWCAGHGLREVWLGTTEKFVAAHRFYEKHGFERVERSALPPGFEVMAVDTRFYRWAACATAHPPAHR
jgi:N-acetylglutamate synthase-like GNAT family acetyltransferase